MQFDDKEVARLATLFHLFVLILAPFFILAGIALLLAGQTWAWVVVAMNLVIFLIFIPLYLNARKRRKRLQ